MIVEFIGSTGVGKTTLITAVQRELSKSLAVTTSFDLVATPLGLQGIKHSTVKNLIQELIALPYFVHSLPKHKAFLIFAIKMLARQSKFSFLTISNLRSLERKIGVYEIIKRYKYEQIVFVDEGTVLSAHNIFVFTNASYSSEEIATFANLTPLPDLIVYIKAPVESLINRSLQRTDRRRELESMDREQIAHYIKRAVTMFEQLVSIKKIRSRTLTVENPDFAGNQYDQTVNLIVDLILTYDPSKNRASVLRPLTPKPIHYLE